MHQHLKNLIAGQDPPGTTSKTSIVARSLTGRVIITFDDPEKAASWARQRPSHRITWFRQTIIEEEVQINI